MRSGLAGGDHLLRFNDPLLSCPGSAVRKRHWCQSHHRHWVIIRGNPVLPLDAAAIAVMHQHLLSIRPKGHADRGHQRAAGTLPVAWPPQIDVPGRQAKGTVVPVLATRDRLSHEHAALAAAKGLAFVPAHFRSERRSHSACMSSLSTRPGIFRCKKHLVVFQVGKFGSSETWQCGVLRLGNRPGRSRTIGTQALSTQNILSCGNHGLQAARALLALHTHRPGSECLGMKCEDAEHHRQTATTRPLRLRPSRFDEPGRFRK